MDFSLRDLCSVVFCLLISVSVGQAEVSPVEIEFSTPKSVSLNRVNSGESNLTLNITNTSDERVVMWPYFSAYLVDSTGKLQKQTKRVERWENLSEPSVLEAVQFRVLKPGEKIELKVSVSQFDLDADAIMGWQVPTPGDYQFVLRCHFNRELVKKRYGDGCKGIDNPAKPWNQALEMEQRARVDFTVKR